MSQEELVGGKAVMESIVVSRERSIAKLKVQVQVLEGLAAVAKPVAAKALRAQVTLKKQRLALLQGELEALRAELLREDDALKKLLELERLGRAPVQGAGKSPK